MEEGGLGGAGLLTGLLGGEGDIGDEGILQPLAAVEEGIDEFDGGELAAAEEGAGLGDAEVGKVNGLWHRVLLPLQGSRPDGAERIACVTSQGDGAWHAVGTAARRGR